VLAMMFDARHPGSRVHLRASHVMPMDVIMFVVMLMFDAQMRPDIQLGRRLNSRDRSVHDLHSKFAIAHWRSILCAHLVELFECRRSLGGLANGKLRIHAPHLAVSAIVLPVVLGRLSGAAILGAVGRARPLA
jgi:hypothetical protein